MKEYRHECGGVLRLWDRRCPYCHQSTLGWQHLLVITLVAAASIYYLLRVF
jgi:RNA polymerase subunit RPABC4/transcription elongation factor Spt4